MPEFSDGADVPSETKAEVRHRTLAHRHSLSDSWRAAAAMRVCAELVDLVRRLRPRRMTGYVPVGSEPGGPGLPDSLLAALDPEAELLLPVLREDLDLDWARYEGMDHLIAAGRGIREPVGQRLGVSAVTDAELVVVPALAVDRFGSRLGRGGGSYDRALARVSARALTVALLYDGELIDHLAVEPHDRPVRAVITPDRGLLTFPCSP